MVSHSYDAATHRDAAVVGVPSEKVTIDPDVFPDEGDLVPMRGGMSRIGVADAMAVPAKLASRPATDSMGHTHAVNLHNRHC